MRYVPISIYYHLTNVLIATLQGSGYCFRLYTEESFRKMPITAEPEIRRCTLTSSLLQLKCLGQDLEELDFMDKPDESTVASALKTLFLLGALDNRKALTPLGRQMAAFPLEPPLARALVASTEMGCTAEVLTIISVLSASSHLFVDTHDARDAAADARRKFRHLSGDHLTVLNVVRAYEEVAASESKAGRRDWCRKMFLNERCLSEAMNIRAQLRDVCARMDVDWKASAGDNEVPILKALVRGLVENTAFLQADGSYKQVMGSSVRDRCYETCTPSPGSTMLRSLPKYTDSEDPSELLFGGQESTGDNLRRTRTSHSYL